MIKGKFVVIDTLSNFEAQKDSFSSSSIVFIKDVGRLYTHGTYFGADLLTKTANGLAPKGGDSASSQISNVNTEWVLTVTSGSNPSWRKLPASSFYYRPISVNGTSFLGNNNTALNLVAGTNISLTTGTNGAVTIDTSNTPTVNQAIPYIVGSTTDTTGSWTGTYEGITAYTDGLTIVYVPKVAGASTTKLNINGLGEKVCYYTNSSNLTTHFSVDTPIILTYVGGYWKRADYSNWTPYVAAYCGTAAGIATKTAICSSYALLSKSYLHILITNSNTAASALTLNVNSQGAKPIYINGTASSSSNYTLPAGTYIVYYDGTNYYFRTDGVLTANITGSSTQVSNDLVLKIKTGTTEGTDLYTFNGSAKKTLDIKQGTGITLTAASGALTIANSGVRSIATGSTNGTISVNTNGTTTNVAVKGLGSAAYTASTAYAVNKTLTDEDLNSVFTPGFYAAGGENTVTNKPDGVQHFGLEVIHGASGVYYVQILYDRSYSNIVYRRHCINSTWSSWTLDELTDTTYSVVSSSADGLAPKVISSNTTTLNSSYYVLASSNGSDEPSWYKLPSTAFDSTKYLPLSGGTMTLGEGLRFHADNNYFGTNADARIISLLDSNGSTIDGGLIIDERGTVDGETTVTELLRIKHDQFQWKQQDILHVGNYTSYLGYIGTTAVQASSASQALTGVTNATMSGTTTTGNLIISNTSEVQHILFSRGSSTSHPYNYICAPAGGIITISPNNAGITSTSGMQFSSNGFHPAKTKAYSLGTSSLYWNNLYVSAVNAATYTGGTVTGTMTFYNGSATVDGTFTSQLKGICGNNDHWSIGVGGTDSDFGYLEIRTGDNGDEPIYFSQCNTTGIAVHKITLMDASGNTALNKLTATAVNAATFTGSLEGNATTATSLARQIITSYDNITEGINPSKLLNLVTYTNINNSTDSNGFATANTSSAIAWGKDNSKIILASQAGKTDGSLYLRQYYTSWGNWNLLLHTGNYSTYIYSKSETTKLIDTAIANLVGTAPDILDTLEEIADYLQDGTVVEGLLDQLSQKVDLTNDTYVRTYSRTDIGDAPNFDDPKYGTQTANGLFEVRAVSEISGATGTPPFNSYGPILSFKRQNVMMQFAAENNGNLYYRARQKSGVTLEGVTWKTILDSNNYKNYFTGYYNSTISRTANTVLAAPNGSAGVATFRKLVVDDIPSLSDTYVTLDTTQTISATKTFSGQSATWIAGARGTNVAINIEKLGYVVLSRIKTLNGAITLSSHSAYGNTFTIGYMSDDTITAGTNGLDKAWHFNGSTGVLSSTGGFSGNLTGNVTGNLTGTASQVKCSFSTSNNYRPIIVTNTSNSLYYTTGVTLNYSTNDIKATSFTGSLYGSADLWDGYHYKYEWKGSSDAGYIKLLTITCATIYYNAPIHFKFSSRSSVKESIITITTSGSEVTGINVIGDSTYANRFYVYCVKSSDTINDEGTITNKSRTYEVYVKVSAQQDFIIYDVQYGYTQIASVAINDAFSIVSLPTDYTYMYQSSLGSFAANISGTLSTARTLWGQSFDGSKDISGDISNTGNITPSKNATYSVGAASNGFIRYWANGTGADTGLIIEGSAYKLGFMIGSGNVNRGIYDYTNGSWWIYRTSTTNTIINGYVQLEGAVNSSKTTTTYIQGNQGHAIINSTASAGSYTMLAKMNSTNGYFTQGTYNQNYLLQYTAKTTVDAGTNSVTKSLILLSESGNSTFPGTVTASKLVKSGSSDDYVLLGGGGHKSLDELVTSSSITSIAKTLALTTSWLDTGIDGDDFETGTYLVQISASNNNQFYDCYWSGIMSWWKGRTNDTDTDEIILHRAGRFYNSTIYLRTIMQSNTDTNGFKLQIAGSTNIASTTYTFKFKKMI